MNLPLPGRQYDFTNEAQARAEIERADRQNRKSSADVEIGPQKLVLTSPDGTRWNVTVSNSGAITATAL
jgi:hypothetical protein